jgi:hypothetical protein
MFNKAHKIIEEKLDIHNYLKFINEYLYLKGILLNEVHSLSLNYMEKPNLLYKNKFNYLFIKEEKKIAQIVNYFRNKNNFTNNDEEIYNLLSNDLKELIKN